MYQIFTTGYLRKRPHDLAAMLEEMDAQLVDIRLRPWSQAPCWRSCKLRELVGRRYTWVRDLGNELYKAAEFKVRLVNVESGIEQVLEIARRRRVVLLCACEELNRCHRRTVAIELLVRAGVQAIEILSWQHYIHLVEESKK
jgi:uncharacterized protein (DUF488 family)